MVGLVEHRHLDRAEVAVARLIRSSSRPGHATTMSTPWRSAWTCGSGPTPPKTVRVRRPCDGGQRREGRVDLSDELTGRGEDQRPGGFGTTGAGWRAGRPAAAGTRRLAGAGAAPAEDVAAGEGVRQRGGLDRGGVVMPPQASTSARSAGTPSSRKEEDKGSFANRASVSPQSRRRMSPRRSGVVEHRPLRYECCNTHQDRGKTELSLCPNRRAPGQNRRIDGMTAAWTRLSGRRTAP